MNLYGATGREAGVADAVEALVKDHVDSIRRDALGNLICESAATDPDGKRIMAVGAYGPYRLYRGGRGKEGFLRVMPVGGVGLAVSRTRHVSFQNGVQGVIVKEEKADFVIYNTCTVRENANQRVYGDLAS